MTARPRLQAHLETLSLRAALALPAPVQRVLAGSPIIRDGQTLAVDTQLMLRMQRLVREPGAETLPIPEGRAAILRHAGMTAGRQPIGSVRDLTVAGRPARLYIPSAVVEAASPVVEVRAKRADPVVEVRAKRASKPPSPPRRPR